MGDMSGRAAGATIVAAADWAGRVRPRPLVAFWALFGLSAVFRYLDVENSWAVRLLLLAVLIGLYLFPWLVKMVRSFLAGYRNDPLVPRP
jgi:hypothetical protein